LNRRENSDLALGKAFGEINLPIYIGTGRMTKDELLEY
jgi:hypothetical protein